MPTRSGRLVSESRQLIEGLLRAGGKPAWQIAVDASVTLNYVYYVSREIGVKPKRANSGDNIAAFPPFKPRPRAEIEADLRDQIDGVVRRFNRQLRADRRSDPVK